VKVLIAVASKHQSTGEIAIALGRELSSRGLDVTTANVKNVSALEDYDAVILGSAVYLGRWLNEATDFAKKHQESLKRRSVWLFSSGPLGEPLRPLDQPVDAAFIKDLTAAIGHHLFAGRLERSHLNLMEKAMTAAAHAPEGDFRDWQEVQSWADEIAGLLLKAPEASKK